MKNILRRILAGGLTICFVLSISAPPFYAIDSFWQNSSAETLFADSETDSKVDVDRSTNDESSTNDAIDGDTESGDVDDSSANSSVGGDVGSDVDSIGGVDSMGGVDNNISTNDIADKADISDVASTVNSSSSFHDNTSVSAFTKSVDASSLLKNISGETAQNNIPITESTIINSNDLVNVRVSFSFPLLGDTDIEGAYVKKGDTAQIFVAYGFSLETNAGPFSLTHQGIKIGELKLNTTSDKKIMADITFNGEDEVFDGEWSETACVFNIGLKYDKSGDNGDEGDHSVGILDKTYTVNVPPLPIEIVAEKSGVRDEQIIHWTVKVAATKGGVAADLGGFVFRDNIENVGTYIQGSFKTSTSHDGLNPIVPINDFDTSDVNIEYTFPKNTIGTQFIFLSTKIKDDLFLTNTQQTVTNNAQIFDNDVKKTDCSASVNFKNEWIVKKQASLNNTIGEISWTITANTVKASLSKAVITDKLDTKLNWKSATLEENIDGVWSASSAVIFNNEPSNGHYLVGDINYPIRLTISAILKDTADLLHTVQRIENVATLSWENALGVDSEPVLSDIGFNPIEKTATKYNIPTHTATWNVKVKSSDIVSNLRVAELLVYSNSFDMSASYTITNNSANDLSDISTAAFSKLRPSFNQRFEQSSWSSDATSDLKYTVHTVKNAENIPLADLLVVTKGDGQSIDVNSDSQSFAYNTIVTNPELYLSNKNKNKIDNTAVLLTGDALLNFSSATHTFDSDVLEKDVISVADAQKDLAVPVNVNSATGAANKSFNYKDKSVIYRLHVNASGMKNIVDDITTKDGQYLSNVELTDNLPDGWEFADIVDGSKYLIYDGTNNGGFVKASNLLTAPSFVTADFSVEGEASFSFTSLEKPYLILLKAKPTNDTVKNYFDENSTDTVKNTATIKADNWSKGANDFEEITIEKQVLSKDILAHSDGMLEWKIAYNPHDTEYPNTQIVDTLPNGLDLRTDSKGVLDKSETFFSIYELTYNAEGDISLGEKLKSVASLISYDMETRELRFTVPNVKKGYQFQYFTDITGNALSSLTNKVQFENGHVNRSQVHKSYDVNQADASATMLRSGWIEITKTDENKNALAEAEFTIFTVDGVTPFRKGVSDIDGKLTLRGLPTGNYILKETIAPIGYTLSDALYSIAVINDGSAISTSISGKTGATKNKIELVNYTSGTVGAVSISNKVSGNAPNSKKEFNFTIFADGAEGSFPCIFPDKSTGSIIFSNSIATFKLKGDEKITIQALAKDSEYSVTEDDYTKDGYKTIYTLDKGVIVADSIIDVKFVNTKTSSNGSNSSNDTNNSDGNNRIAKPNPNTSVEKIIGGCANITLVVFALIVLAFVLTRRRSLRLVGSICNKYLLYHSTKNGTK